MQPFDKDPPPPRPSLWDRLSYSLVAILIWAAVLYCVLA